MTQTQPPHPTQTANALIVYPGLIIIIMATIWATRTKWRSIFTLQHGRVHGRGPTHFVDMKSHSKLNINYIINNIIFLPIKPPES